jgi:hypothetical protein
VHQNAAKRTESQNELTPELTPIGVVGEMAIFSPLIQHLDLRAGSWGQSELENSTVGQATGVACCNSGKLARRAELRAGPFAL